MEHGGRMEQFKFWGVWNVVPNDDGKIEIFKFRWNSGPLYIPAGTMIFTNDRVVWEKPKEITYPCFQTNDVFDLRNLHLPSDLSRDLWDNLFPIEKGTTNLPLRLPER